MDLYWNRKAECMSRDELRALQVERLRATVRRAYDSVPHYRKALDERGVRPEHIRGIDDLRLLPFTTKQDLRDNYPYGMFAVPLREVVRVHASSGTTGKPTVVGYTRNDVGTWAELMARTIGCGGGTPDTVLHNAYGYGLFTGGLGIHYGAELMGVTVVPVSGGNTRRQVMLLKDFGPTMLACTPSYALHIAEVMGELGIKKEDLRLRNAILGAEPWTNSMREDIERKLGVSAVDIYGLSEVIGPGVASECQDKSGLHIWEDHFIPEIIDPVTGENLPPGEKGELVFTSLTKEALPIIRYLTRDISSIVPGTCTCGRTHVRMSRISGRTDDMIIIRGVNVFPSQIEEVLLQFSEAEPHYQLVVDRQANLDQMEIWVEVSARFFSDQVKGLEGLRRRIEELIESTLGISVRVKLVEPKTIPRSEGKAKRVVDRREVYKEQG
ncbi:MAG: phenylacetate--CoA ligase [Firmicutes bacterium]|nr:phenylacetate--CoA ligase [Bacillota bacterium]